MQIFSAEVQFLSLNLILLIKIGSYINFIEESEGNQNYNSNTWRP
jgi:hypothetical protein